MMNLTEYGLGDLAQTLEDYVNHGLPTGGFLAAVLSNYHRLREQRASS